MLLYPCGNKNDRLTPHTFHGQGARRSSVSDTLADTARKECRP
nr:MAG TPA: hypothetical protein [Caudoviricetes sp.]